MRSWLICSSGRPSTSPSCGRGRATADTLRACRKVRVGHHATTQCHAQQPWTNQTKDPSIDCPFVPFHSSLTTLLHLSSPPADRMRALLSESYADLDPADAQKKVKKRLALVADLLV
mmetsp:Transcript_49331/g.139677  ORF Transcript_49331/g.139677 Transcript_49331/m.139677 type:complete len:117 (-) Transcript_49331:62-412(-)